MKKLFKMLCQALLMPALLLLAVEAGGAGGSGASGGSNAGSGNGGNGTGGIGGTGGAGGQGGQGGQGGSGTGGQGGKTYSEEEANRIAEERANRAAQAALRSYFEQQGFTKDEVDQLLKEHKAKKEAEKTEAQREKERADKAEAEKKAAINAANAKLAEAAFLVQAVAVGIPSDRVNDAAELVRNQLVELKPDDKTGEFDEKEIKKIAEDLVKAKPWLKGDGGQGGNLGGGSNTGGGGGKAPEVAAKEIAEARSKPRTGSKGYDPWATTK